MIIDVDLSSKSSKKSAKTITELLHQFCWSLPTLVENRLPFLFKKRGNKVSSVATNELENFLMGALPRTAPVFLVSSDGAHRISKGRYFPLN